MHKAWQYIVNNGIVSGLDYNSTDGGCQPFPFPPAQLDEISLESAQQCKQICANGLNFESNKQYGEKFTLYIAQNLLIIQLKLIFIIKDGGDGFLAKRDPSIFV